MGTLRAVFILLVIGVVTPPLMVLQMIFLATGASAARTLPVWWHRFVCRMLGVRLTVEGKMSPARPLLIAANHVSWLDINVLASIAPLSFIAKSEVATWPVFGWLAKLQRSVFVDRSRRTRTRHVNNAIAGRLAAGDVMVLFAEGTSSDGNRVLPFRSALLGAAHELARLEDDDGKPAGRECSAAIHVQPVALIYTRLNGLPMGRQHRPIVAWHGDIDLGPHLWRLLQAGSIDVTVAFGEPIALVDSAGRKSVAVAAERSVRGMAQKTLAGRGATWGVADAAAGHLSATLPARAETG
ncbi:lysophospholipid acyltransferase family protein [Microbaculum marinum]|uniref:Lysophospholipid acyltransferase family protein n=1 Tax=Microbaculum marinum TaxID=1764581 RepID=A0AAW9RR28_9HYPH